MDTCNLIRQVFVALARIILLVLIMAGSHADSKRMRGNSYTQCANTSGNMTCRKR